MASKISKTALAAMTSIFIASAVIKSSSADQVFFMSTQVSYEPSVLSSVRLQNYVSLRPHSGLAGMHPGAG